MLATATDDPYELIEDLDSLIKYISGTKDESWCTERVRTEDGRNCFFGHLFEWAGGGDGFRSQVWDAFESRWSTSYVIYPVNDGTYPGYDQATPRLRCVAYLEALRDGREETTMQSMDRFFAESEAMA